MGKNGEYSVRISGLNDGIHFFDFDIGDSIFKLFEHPDISGGSVKALIQLEKKPGVMTVYFDLKGEVNVICDRCLEVYSQVIAVEEEMYINFGDQLAEINENIILVPRDKHEIIIDHYLFEYIFLALPNRRIHPEKEDGKTGGNPDMIKKHIQHLVKEAGGKSDPRWDELKRLFEKSR